MPTATPLLAGKRIVVTGASRGLGRAFATAAAAHGASVVVNGTNDAALSETARAVAATGGRCEQVVGSVADDASCKEIVDRAVEAFGGIDCLVNNAGIVRDRTLLKMSAEEFDEVIAVNLRGSWACGKYAAAAMTDSGGTIINVISNSGLTGAIGQTNYAASKAGVMGMTLTWARELERYGIRVNALWPVAVTDMTRVVIDRVRESAVARGVDPPTPAQIGLGDADEVANIVVFLASDHAAHLNGQMITFNGSKLALWTHPREVNIARREQWTVGDLVREFDSTAGMPLEQRYDAL